MTKPLVLSETLRANPILLAFVKMSDPEVTFHPGRQGSSTRRGTYQGMEYNFNYIHVLGSAFIQGTVEDRHFIIHAPNNSMVSLFTELSLENCCKATMEGSIDQSAHRDSVEQLTTLTDFVFELVSVERRQGIVKKIVTEKGITGPGPIFNVSARVKLADIISRLLVSGRSISDIDLRGLEDMKWNLQKNDWREDHVRLTSGLREIKVERNLAGSLVITGLDPDMGNISTKVVMGVIDQMRDNNPEVFKKAMEVVEWMYPMIP